MTRTVWATTPDARGFCGVPSRPMRDTLLVMQGVTVGLAIALVVEMHGLRRQMQALTDDVKAAREEIAKPRRTGPPTSGLPHRPLPERFRRP